MHLLNKHFGVGGIGAFAISASCNFTIDVGANRICVFSHVGKLGAELFRNCRKPAVDLVYKLLNKQFRMCMLS